MTKQVPYLEYGPVDLDAEGADAFGHGDYAKTIVTALEDCPRPLTIGLFAEWGLGKTSVLGAVQKALPGDWAFAYFDVWRYEGDALRRQFLRDVSRQLENEGHLGDGFRKRLERLEVDTTEAGQSGRVVDWYDLLLLVVPLVVLGAAGLLKPDFFWQAASVVGVVVGFCLSQLRSVFKPGPQIHRHRLEDPELFTREFEQMLHDMKKRHLLVAIDNLDRCPPEKATELLTTVKTYLEPSSTKASFENSRKWRYPFTETDNEAVFIVAADEKALRRHLLAQEMQLSGEGNATSSGRARVEREPGERARDEAAEYVDEYLRKFFGVSIRMRPLLPLDMRQFVGQQLEALVRSEELNESMARTLVEMVTSALRKNPRRVKQFSNNLALKLDLYRRRGGTPQTCSEELLVIAKLAIIEELWPVHFASLLDDARAMDGWQEQMRQGQRCRLGEDIDTFLWATRDVQVGNIRPLLFLNRSDSEAFYRYDEFRQAMQTSDVLAMQRVIDECDEAALREYAEELPKLIQAEASDSYWLSCGALLELVFTSAMASRSNAVLGALREAVVHDELAQRLRELPLGPALDAAFLLPSMERKRMIELYADLEAFEGPQLTEVAHAFSHKLAEMEKGEKELLKKSLSSPAIIENMAACLPLVQAEPDLLPDEATDRAVSALPEDFTVDSEAVRVLRVALKKDNAEETSNAIVNAAREALPDASQPPPDELLKVVRSLLPELSLPSDDAGLAFVRELLNRSADWPFESQEMVLSVVGPLCDIGLEDVNEDAAKSGEEVISRMFSQHTDEFVDYVRRTDGRLPASFTSPVIRELSAIVSSANGAEPLEIGALSALNMMSHSAASEATGAGVSQAARRNQWDVVERYVSMQPQDESDGDSLAAWEAERTNAVVPVLLPYAQSTQPQQRRASLGALGICEGSMSDTDLIRYGEALARNLGSSDVGDAECAARLILDSPRSAAWLSSETGLLEAARSRVSNEPDRIADSPLLVRLVARGIPLLAESPQDAVLRRLSTSLAERPQSRKTIARAFSDEAESILSLPVRKREELVRELIGADTEEPDVDTRLLLLEAAGQVCGRGGPRSRVKTRLAELEKGSEQDIAVLGELSSSLPEGLLPSTLGT